MAKDLEVETPVWKACPPGEFQRAARRLELREARRNLAQLSSLAVAAVVLVALGVQARGIAFSKPTENLAGGISCSEVRQIADGQGFASIDPVTRGKVVTHVKGCPHCAALPPTQLAQLKRGANSTSGEIQNVRSSSHCD